ncbi:hypothetical protein [Antarctobacter heliothermus]|uniref:Uncharacterized protein n=1 Tax=Antarctobacter heliothermus TaxID=74033 RepID=A0A239EB97_9RHOB|nr:hypothetical protein [Antarctobacter heliothermus]SNS42030.1 hypothetical protein SAMN04488078_101453 [Antarctobacter heliothermus]
MTRLRSRARMLGWIALVALTLLAVWQGIGPAALRPGGWFGTLAAGLVLAVGLWPGRSARALPAAALATFLGGVLFSVLPQMQGQGAAVVLMLGAGGAACLSAFLFFEGRGAVGVAVLGGALHVGLIEVLTTPPMASPFALWPWSAPGLLAVWLVVGIGISLIAPRSAAAPRRAAKDNPRSAGSR